MSDSNAIEAIDPRRTAIAVLDYQPGILRRLEQADALTARAAAAIATVRDRGGTVAYVRVGFTDGDLEGFPETSRMGARLKAAGPAVASMHADSPLTQIDDRVAPREGDIIVRKVRVGAFSTTQLDALLRERAIDTLLIAGVSTSGAVLSTVRDADDRDYRVIVLADACEDPDEQVHRFLTERLFPHHCDVIAVSDLERLLPS